MKFVIIIVVLVLLCILAVFLIFRPKTKTLCEEYYVIHLDRAKNRLNNIRAQQKKLGQKLTIAEAIDVETLPDEFAQIETQHSISIPTLWGSKAELACYLSHLRLLRRKTHSGKYILVFEDDFDVSISNFDTKLNSLLVDLERANEQFDVLYLGNLTNYQGEPVPKIKLCTRLAKSDIPCWGTHAYVVRTDSLERLTQHLSTVSESYDGKLQTLAYEEQIRSLALKTNWVTQFGDDQSYIRSVPYHLMKKAINDDKALMPQTNSN